MPLCVGFSCPLGLSCPNCMFGAFLDVPVPVGTAQLCAAKVTPMDAELSAASLMFIYTKKCPKTQGFANLTCKHLEPHSAVLTVTARAWIAFPAPNLVPRCSKYPVLPGIRGRHHREQEGWAAGGCVRAVQRRCSTAVDQMKVATGPGKKFSRGTYSPYRAAKSGIMRESVGKRETFGSGCREALQEEWMGKGRRAPRVE